MSTSTIVLFGGSSDERHVSVATAQNVIRALGEGFAWFWAPNGAVHDVAVPDLLSHAQPFERDYVPSRPAIFPTLEQALDTLPVDDPAMFLALHGGTGEDGTVQRMLEERGIAFTGSGSEASAAAFDKARAKQLVMGRVNVAESRIASGASQLRAAVDALLERHERIVLKPLAGGSSRGLYFLGRDRDEDRAVVIAQAIAHSVPYIVEQFVRGRELTCGVIDSSAGPRGLPVIEIEVDSNRAFDYEGKYLGKGTREICPARIPDALAKATKEAAVAAHVALGCAGYSRSDFIAGDEGVWFLELNTLPGLTVSSLVPQELAVEGIAFREFLSMQVAEARSRRAKRLRTPSP